MTRKFELYSTKTGRSAELVYFENNLIGVTFEQSEYINAMFFSFVGEQMATIEAMLASAKVNLFRITETVELVDFEKFWLVYNHKFDRKRAQDKWNKLSESDKRGAFAYISQYKMELLRSGVSQMHARTYLHNQVWK